MTQLKFKVFPKVTTSKTKFIKYAIQVCKDFGIPNNVKEKWIEYIRTEDFEAHYFYNMIFISRISFRLILHEFVHHVASKLRGQTLSDFWYCLDFMADMLEHLI